MQRQIPADVKYIVGSSLYMWSELWPEAQITGIDIRPDVLINERNIRSFCMDQFSQTDMQKLAAMGPYDLIIDDGSHKIEHQIFSAQQLLPALTPDGIYVIEDVLPKAGFHIISELGCGDLLILGKTWDDCMVVIDRITK